MVSIRKHIKKIGLLITFLLLGYLVNPFNLSFVFGYLLVLTVVVKKNFIQQNLDLNFVLIALFSIVFALFYAVDPAGGIQFVFIYATAPPFFYLLGKYLIQNVDSQQAIYNILVIIGFILSTSYLISVLINFFEGGFSQLDRNLPYFWTGDQISATIMGAYFSFNMCIPALLISDQGRSNWFHKIVATIIFILTLICVLRIGSRTQLGIMLITTLISFFYMVPRQSLKQNFFLFVSIAIVLTVVFQNVSFDLSEDWLSTFASRMDNGAADIASGGGRTDRWIKSINNMFEKPLGWGLHEFGYAHNLWFDVLRAAGVIPFFLLIIFTTRSFITAGKIIAVKSLNVNFRLIILVYTTTFFLIFMVEPIMDGLFALFSVFCLYSGILAKLKTKVRASQKNSVHISTETET